MALPLLPISARESGCCSLFHFTLPDLSTSVQIVLQVALRILFPLGGALMIAAMAPLSFQAIALPPIAIGLSFLSSFFFQENIFKRCSLSFPTLPHFVVGESAEVENVPQAPAILPQGVARGLRNRGGANCCVNAAAQFLRLMTPVHRWLRNGEDLPQGLLPVRLFFQAYRMDQAENRAVSRANSQMLRTVVSRLSRFDPEDEASPPLFDPLASQQDDAFKAVHTILDRIPNAWKGKMVETTEYDVTGKVPIAPDPTRPQVQVVDGRRTIKELPLDPALQIKINEPYPQLGRMLEHHFDHPIEAGGTGMPLLATDGTTLRYHALRKIIQYAELPRILVIQVGRFGYERPKQNWLSQLPKIGGVFQYFWPNLSGGESKNQTPVEVPTQITLQDTQGRRQVFGLKAMIQHHGSSVKSGHYTSDGIENDRHWYHHDDDKPIKRVNVDQVPLSQAYVLGYLPVGPLQPAPLPQEAEVH